MAVKTDDIVKHHLHVGSLKAESNPKTRRFWLDVAQGLTILNPEMIAQQLDNAKAKVAKAKAEGKEILVICEKELYVDEVSSTAESLGVHYLNYKVPAGFLTNFDTLITRIDGMNQKKKFVESEEYEKLTKKEQVMIKRKLQRVEKVYEWVKNLKKKPDLVLVVDGWMMSGFIDEIEVAGVDNIVLASSDFGRRWEDSNLIMMNMQSYGSLDFALQYIFTK